MCISSMHFNYFSTSELKIIIVTEQCNTLRDTKLILYPICFHGFYIIIDIIMCDAASNNTRNQIEDDSEIFASKHIIQLCMHAIATVKIINMMYTYYVYRS